jgi:hypothetical protein
MAKEALGRIIHDATDYDALAIETQTVETNNFHFDGGLLVQLNGGLRRCVPLS